MPANPSPFVDEEYFDIFITGHYKRIGSKGIPDPRSPEGIEEYDTWRKTLIAEGVEAEDADAASDRLADHPVLYKDHFIAFLRYAAESAKRRAESKPLKLAEVLPEKEKNYAARDYYESLSPDLKERLRKKLIEAHPDVADTIRRCDSFARAMSIFHLKATLQRRKAVGV